MPDPLAMHI